MGKPKATPLRSAGTGLGIPELYRRCLAGEQNSRKQDMDKLKLILAKGLFLGRPFFEPPPTVDESSAISKETDLKIRRQLWEAGKYRDILDLVRTQTKREGRLFLLAWWLSQEKVCEPEDIVGIEVLRRLAKKTFPFYSPSDFDHVCRVSECLPYFEKLLADFATHKGAFSELVKLGYDEAAIRTARKKRSAIPAACEWLAERDPNVDALTLQNAYSRFYGLKRRSVHESADSAEVINKWPTSTDPSQNLYLETEMHRPRFRCLNG
jgi:hypothetical protein